MPEPGLRSGEQLVFDTSVLSAFAEAERLDLLGHHLVGTECFVTDVVREEIRVGSEPAPAYSRSTRHPG